MTERDLFAQLKEALVSPIGADVVRLWLWLRVVQNGSCPHKTLKTLYPVSTKTLETALRKKLVRLTRDEVVAEQWKMEIPGKCDSSGNVQTNTVQVAQTYVSCIEEVILREKTDGVKFVPRENVRPKRRRTRKPTQVEIRLDNLEGREKVMYALEHPTSKFAAKVIRGGTIRTARSYCNAYKERTGKDYWPSRIRKNETQFRGILRWCTHHEIRPDEWFRFCAKKYRPVFKGFPPPANCAGEWVRAEWEKDNTSGNRHAGHTYKDVSGDLRGTLSVAGFDVTEYDDEMLRYLEERAGEKNSIPELYTPEPDAEAEVIVDWLVTHRES